MRGTRHVLDLARDLPYLERFHHASTCYVSGRHPGTFAETDLHVGQTFNNHYEESKHAAEVQVRAAAAAGMPVTVYRPSVVVSDSVTGETQNQKLDGPYVVVRLLLRRGRRALLPMVGDPERIRFNAVPRDWVVEAAARLAARPDTTRYATEETQAALGGFAPPRFVDYLPMLVEFVRRNPGVDVGGMV